MTLTVSKKRDISGIATCSAIASKSAAHRLLILCALAKKESPTEVLCAQSNDDIDSTVSCLSALGADIIRTEGGFSVLPIDQTKKHDKPCELHVGESGSTLRFLLPILGVLGIDADIYREGRLPKRPLSPLDTLLTAHGMQIEADKENEAILHVRGALRNDGTPYTISGGVSSQNITGLLVALALCKTKAELRIEGELSSAPYVDMTLDALKACGVAYTVKERKGGRVYRKPKADICPPDTVAVEGDWSSAAAILCAGALSGGVTLSGLDIHSRQGDKAILSLLEQMGAQIQCSDEGVTVLPPKGGRLKPVTVSAEHTPDLVPVLAVTCGAACGKSIIKDCGRLRLKESDRLAATEALLLSLGVAAFIDGDDLHIFGVCEDLKKSQATQNESTHTPPPVSDHRMVMAAAIGALYTSGAVNVPMAESVGKSYPRFFEDITAFCAVTQTESEDEAICQAPTETV